MGTNSTGCTEWERDFDPVTEQPMTPPNPWARISEVAARLGVKPVEHGKPATITCVGGDGNSYDIWEVVIAFLDKMHKHE
jgi:hypothetical protein